MSDCLIDCNRLIDKAASLDKPYVKHILFSQGSHERQFNFFFLSFCGLHWSWRFFCLYKDFVISLLSYLIFFSDLEMTRPFTYSYFPKIYVAKKNGSKKGKNNDKLRKISKTVTRQNSP